MEIDDLGQLEGIIKDIATDFRAIRYRDILGVFSDELESTHDEYFNQDQNPGGRPWAPLAPSTVRRKGHDTILEETGRLRQSLTQKSSDAIRSVWEQAHDQGLVFGTEVPYTIFHQEGTTNMPDRKPVGVNRKKADEWAQRVADDTVRKLAEGKK